MRIKTVVVWAAVAGMAMATLGQAQERTIRSAKTDAVGFYLASDAAVRGFEAVTVRGGGTLHVAPEAILTAADIVGMDSFEAADGTELSLTLTDDAADRLAQALGKQSADKLAMFMHNRVVAAGTLTFDADSGMAIMGALNSRQARRITDVLDGAAVVPQGPTVMLSAPTTNIQPGETVLVDVFATGFEDLRSYQVTLKVEGGDAGTVNVSDLWINKERADWAFGGVQAVQAVDKIGGRMGAALWQGSVTTPQPRYLGTFQLTASDTASGTFEVGLRTDSSSLFLKADSTDVPGVYTQDLTLTVGSTGRLAPSK